MLTVDGRGTPGRGPAWSGDLPGHRLPGPAGPGGRAARRRRGPAGAGPEPGRDPRLVIRRVSRCPGRAAPARRVPRRGGRGPAHRSADVRHALARAVTWAIRTPTRRSTTSARLLGDAPALTRPLLLIHGLADDNVFPLHTLRLSAALLAAGRPHEVLPLPGITHAAGGTAIVANMLLHQLGFLRRALKLGEPPAYGGAGLAGRQRLSCARGPVRAGTGAAGDRRPARHRRRTTGPCAASAPPRLRAS